MPDSNETHDWQQPRKSNLGDPLGILGSVIFNKYKVEKYIGGGGFGKIYMATNNVLKEQKVVIKFFTQIELQDRFIKEGRILSKLDHPNICHVIDYLPVERALVMQYIQGDDLEQILLGVDRLEPSLYLKIMRLVTEALQYAHSLKIAHRDIKPSNIMIAKDGRIFLIDFGIAKEISKTATKTKANILTPQFAAPERHSGDKDYDPFLSDIYELGVTLFFLATRQKLYHTSENPYYEEWDAPHTSGLSTSLKNVLMKATHPNPSLRYRSISEMRVALSKVKTPYVRPRKKKAILIVLLISIIAMIAVYVSFDDHINKWLIPQGQVSNDKPRIVPQPVDNLKPTPAQDEKQEDSPAELPIEIDSATSVEKEEALVKKQEAKQVVAEPELSNQISHATKPEEIVPEEPIKVRPVLSLSVLPVGNYRLEINDNLYDQYLDIELDTGIHHVVIEHEDYPLYSFKVDMASDTVFDTVDLMDLSSKISELNVLLALKPETNKFGFDLSFNGKSFVFNKSPVFNFARLSGGWRISAKLLPFNMSNEEVKIDSIVVWPYDRSPKILVEGSEGKIVLGTQNPERLQSRILIHWSHRD